MIIDSLHTKISGRKEIIFFSLIFFIAGLILYSMPRLAIPLGVAYILFLIINPIIPTITKFVVSRNLAIALVFVGFLAISVIPITQVIPVINTELSKIDDTYIDRIANKVRYKVRHFRTEVKKSYNVDVGDGAVQQVLDYSKDATKAVISGVPSIIGSFLEWLFLVPLLLFFLLKDSRMIKTRILMLAPNSIFERFYYLTYKFNKKLGDYIFAKFIEASIIGIIITSGLFFIGVRFSFLLGLTAAITNIIPYVGPFLGMLPALIFAFVEYGANSTFGAILVLYIVANTIDLALVFPILVSKIVDLHPVLVVISVIIGSQYMGIIGMVISIPLLAALKLILEEIYIEIYSKKKKRF